MSTAWKVWKTRTLELADVFAGRVASKSHGHLTAKDVREARAALAKHLESAPVRLPRAKVAPEPTP